MLSTMRSSWLLFVLMALVAMSAAFSVEDAINIDGINAYLHHGQKRQAQGTGATTPADTPSSSAAAPSSTPDAPSSSAPAPSTSADAPSTSASPSDDTPASTPQASKTSAANTPTSTAPAVTKSSAQPSLSTKQLVSTEVAPSTVVITVTNGQGQTSLQTSVTSHTIEHTTGSVVETSLPNTQKGSSGGGLSSSNKSIIGGVVGGVGGAILLGGIALVCWRMWGKKKRVSEDDADLMAGTGSALGDKSHTGASPFQSNLEQYHNPGGRPNAAANF